jgi:hypothetical protein
VKDGEEMRRCDVRVDHGEVMRGGATGRSGFFRVSWRRRRSEISARP